MVVFLYKTATMKEFVITVSKTNNPAILKFESNHILTSGTSHEYRNIDEAKDSPLARQLFYLPFIKTVYISGNFIAIERFDIVEWADIKDELAQQLVEYLNSGEPVVAFEPEKNKSAVTIYAEVTPNPAVMKFVANRMLVPAAFEFKDKAEGSQSGLADTLFEFPYVKEVFMDENYVSVSKHTDADWDDITLELREKIRDYIASGKQVVSDDRQGLLKNKVTVQTSAEPMDDTSKEIIAILEEYVKPAVASDGGNILFQSYEEDSRTVNVILQGACSGCPSSTFTLKNGIETMLKEMMGDRVREVVALNG